jgi:hypothetical protein
MPTEKNRIQQPGVNSQVPGKPGYSEEFPPRPNALFSVALRRFAKVTHYVVHDITVFMLSTGLW